MFVLLTAAVVAAASLPSYAARFGVATAGKACNCPQIVDQVQCSNGKIYTNQCFANCDHARDCVRIGP
jgi:hypothetical protein